MLMVLAPFVFLVTSCDTAPVYPTLEETTESVVQLERDALDNWSAGNPGGFTLHMAEDVTYMDDIMAFNLKKGLEAVQAYMNSLDGMIGPHDYEMVDPFVQQYNSVAILTFHYEGSVNGQKGQPWKTTSVYNYRDGVWKMVHANWSLVKQPSEEGAAAEEGTED